MAPGERFWVCWMLGEPAQAGGLVRDLKMQELHLWKDSKVAPFLLSDTWHRNPGLENVEGTCPESLSDGVETGL